ncbi:RsmB/NOP family class I SAM-dependent RNA methyltransferase [Parvibaculum sp.]|uniref:RsmB/NOP family class I SAM-dependent RNA methyltransferase n=1 Tax=Parvibaculum sp. TaxID=2024848 RepID=UPI001B02A474|nr:RsmB/NOP family class I SAM-dependent RNA methyltransferase [Parvibaculum sp.]MBO6667377.1 RsmB/NOP family class I SAM-dependent RNA methyltransferase [Parvibaculum sp.]MBO6693088.1 RsmB/NOP family class I SAM-dependent RNA methyltransferase [Parvibaculum sp.]MBO6713929.1 RsmB/NOP family class I SAM-dependent RNA methyltransferase [Parvibaculum sp.]
MTPGARLQSAIEILEDIFLSGRPADRIVENWSRSNRYAGSKDRAAISELVYTVLRRRAELSAATDHEDARLLAFAALALVNGEDIAALADGSRHAPAPLSEDERKALDAAALPGADAAPWIRLNYPEWLHSEFEAAFGSELEREMGALMERAPTDLRVNTLKTDREAARVALEEAGLLAEPCPWSPWGLRLTTRGNLPGLALYREGAIEIQDEGSQIACLLTGVKPGEQVVDLCAGGGGKSLALAAMMENKGQIYACDTDSRRLAPLEPRAQRAGIRNLQTAVLRPWHPGAADSDLAGLTGRADCVLVDAPCSGTGAWRRSPDARWRLGPDTLEGYRAAQEEVLARAAGLVRPGGRIVYVTCSLLPCENERQVEFFLERHQDFEPLSWAAAWPEAILPPPAPPGPSLRLAPASSGTDGFFVAILRRKGGK